MLKAASDFHRPRRNKSEILPSPQMTHDAEAAVNGNVRVEYCPTLIEGAIEDGLDIVLPVSAFQFTFSVCVVPLALRAEPEKVASFFLGVRR